MDASTWELIRANLWPMFEATISKTLPLTAISFSAGLVLALFVALARMSKYRLLSGAARFYISIIRGTPLLLQLFLIFYGLPGFGITFDPFPAAVLAFTLNVGGYAAEIIRASILSVAHGQWEAAYSVGMTYWQTLGTIILPQGARIAVPPLSNTLISLVKDTSLASTVLVTELFRTAQLAAAPSFSVFELYTVAALYYWVICLILGFGQTHLETRLARHVAR
ncbi:amino acid ABC transporter permease [Nocardia sp. NPDC005978]|uniref:amino acid ABC transporter permease n=1 Tax=unclassified Nocardia TaxID=2637762 RepID=UPI0033A25577